MLNFILQDSILPLSDIGIELLRAKEYWDWRNSWKKEEWEKTRINIFYPGQKLPKDTPVNTLCPVGTVEFVVDWFKLFFPKIIIKPINIPQSIIGQKNLTGRKIINIEAGNRNFKSIKGNKVFVKSRKIIKDPKNGLYNVESKELEKIIKTGEWQISEYIEDIISEWRVFVYKGEIIDIKCYLGDPFIIPEKKRVEEMIGAVEDNMPISYTLDIFCTKKGESFILEIHDFFGCGLYGMSEPEKYPFMLYRWFKEKIKDYGRNI